MQYLLSCQTTSKLHRNEWLWAHMEEVTLLDILCQVACPQIFCRANRFTFNVGSDEQQKKIALTEARSALAKAQDDMTPYYNRRREPAQEYTPGEKVYLDGSDIQTSRPSKKLAHCFLRPYVVERHIGLYAYHLWLPQSMSHLHPVFPVVKLMPAPVDLIPGRQSDPPLDPILVDGEEHYEVEAVLDSRMLWG